MEVVISRLPSISRRLPYVGMNNKLLVSPGPFGQLSQKYFLETPCAVLGHTQAVPPCVIAA